MSAPAPRQPGLRAGAIILAAGASTRMGTAKQLLPVNGKPLLAHTVEAVLATELWPAIVVVGAHADAVRSVVAPYPALIVENEAWAEGMASSVRAGVGALQQFSRALDGALLALCDQPHFSSETVTRLLAAQRTSGRSIAAARYLGRNAAPAFFLREHFAQLTTLTGEAGARELLNSDPDRTATVDLPELALDLDTPADYAPFRPSA
jgi:CTP:molybdopterin cytidylyltransferase MocA